MKRVLKTFSSERGSREIHYDLFSMSEIESQIAEYERKYGIAFSQFYLTYEDEPGSEERWDCPDWKCLLEELEERQKAAQQDKVSR